MTIVKQRLLYFTGVAALTAAILFLLALFASHAHADTGPIVAAQTATQTGWDLVQQYGPIWGGVLLAFGVLSKTVQSGVLSQGRVLAALTVVVGLVGAVLEWHFGGGQSAGLVVSLAMAIKMIMSPTVKSTGATVAKTGAVMLVLLCTASLGCGARQRAGAGLGAGVGSFVDCQAPHLKAAWTELLGLAQPAIESTISGSGHVDTAAFKAAIGGVRSDAGRCAVDAAIAALLAAATAKPSAVMAAPMAVDVQELRTAYAAVRAEHGWPAMAVR